MDAGRIVLTEKGWLFYFFDIFSIKKNKTLRLQISKNTGVDNDPRDRKFNIKRQQEMYDGSGKFVRLWTQEELF